MESQNTSVRVEVSRTHNLGNYESVRYSFEISEFVPSDSSTKKHLELLTSRLEVMMAEKMMEYGELPRTGN